MKKKAVELRFRQRVSAVLLDGVLRGEHEEGRGELVRGSGDGDGLFLHRFEQRRLGFGRGAIDFIRQQHVAEDRAGLELENLLSAALDEDLRADDVRWQQVRRELNALELQMQRFGQRVDQGRFAKARNAFQQHMPAADHGGEHMLDDVMLADDEFGDFCAEFFEGFLEVRDGGRHDGNDE